MSYYLPREENEAAAKKWPEKYARYFEVLALRKKAQNAKDHDAVKRHESELDYLIWSCDFVTAKRKPKEVWDTHHFQAKRQEHSDLVSAYSPPKC